MIDGVKPTQQDLEFQQALEISYREGFADGLVQGIENELGYKMPPEIVAWVGRVVTKGPTKDDLAWMVDTGWTDEAKEDVKDVQR